MARAAARRKERRVVGMHVHKVEQFNNERIQTHTHTHA